MFSGQHTYIFITALAAFGVFFLVAVGVILVLWIATPFSLFGVKGLLRKMIDEQVRTNSLLKSMLEEAQKKNSAQGGQG
ncbi:MAG: hypothetical protein AABZ23_00095, partial [Deltaproteobacteria bacterium]